MAGSHEAGSAVGAVLVENERVRITEWRFPKRGDNTGWHRHGHDYAVVPLFDGTLEIKNAQGEILAVPMTKGGAYFRQKGVEHDVINGNDFAYAFVEIELLD